MSASDLFVGFGQAEITPPQGLLMCGGLDPRVNVESDDPLLAKALVAEAGGSRIAIIGVDLIGLPREIVDPAIAEAARRTGIDAQAIIISCSHTHSGPYTFEGLYSFGVTDAAYLRALPGLIADSIEQAARAVQPATMHIGRSLMHHGLHHRRVLCKDGRAYNTWMSGALDDLERCPQIVGSCGPIDPELWAVRFDDDAGRPLGVFWNYSLHVNSHFGTTWSADYPGVVAERLRDVLGRQVISVFTPGACANINPTMGFREGAEHIAQQTLAALQRARKVEGPIAVDALRRDVAVPRRDSDSQPAGTIERLEWSGQGGRADVFAPQLAHVASMPETLLVPVSAACLGPLAVATNAGELFVEHGLAIKQRSPFPHTVVAEMTNDVIMYQPTRQAFEQQGYETLVGPNRVAMEGIECLVDAAVALLDELWATAHGSS